MGGGVSQPGQDVSSMAAPPGEAIGVAKVNCCFSFLFVISHFPSSPEKPSGVDCFFLIFLQDFFDIDDAVGLMVRRCAGKLFFLSIICRETHPGLIVFSLFPQVF